MMYDKQQDTRPEGERKKLGGGSTSAVAFNIIAERVMAMRLSAPLEEAVDNNNPMMPAVMNGNIDDADFVIAALGMGSSEESGETTGGWGSIEFDNEGNIERAVAEIESGKVPDVTGMGAKDATYLLQLCNLEVIVEGYGKVVSQDIEPGSEVERGEVIRIELEP